MPLSIPIRSVPQIRTSLSFRNARKSACVPCTVQRDASVWVPEEQTEESIREWLGHSGLDTTIFLPNAAPLISLTYPDFGQV
jgi:hypothetical protein